MDLLSPGTGLLFWSFIIFTLLFLLLSKIAWKPLLSAIKERENTIDNALKSAEEAKNQMTNLKSENEKLLKEEREKREVMMKDAIALANKIKDDAKVDAQNNADKILEKAKNEIENQKKQAIKEIQNEVADLSLSIAEKVMRNKLKGDKAQKDLVQKYLEEMTAN